MRIVNSIRRLVRFVFWCSVVILIIVACTLALFRWRSELREQMSAEDFAPFTGGFIKTPYGQLFVQEIGPAKGTVVLLVHGTGAWSETWKPTMESLAATGYRTIAVDLPPFGYSQRSAVMDYSKAVQGKRINALLDAMNITQVILVGHSFGAGPVVEAAMQKPERIARLVIVDGALSIHDKTEAVDKSLLQKVVSIGARSVPLRNAVVATFITNPAFTKTLLQKFVAEPYSATDEYVAIYQRPMNIKGGTEAVGAWLPELIDPSLPARSENPKEYQQLNIPVALIWGKRDSITPLKQAEQLHALIPGSSLAVMDQVGHIPQIENNSAFNAALVTALKTTDANSSSVSRSSRK